MNWDDFRHVLAIGRTGTLAAAGRELRVDPTKVGRRLISIETELEARLFERTADGFVITPAGTLVVSHAEEIEARTRVLSQQVAGSDTRVAGQFCITSLDVFFNLLLIPALPRLLARYPDLEPTFSSDTDTVDLSRREADVALRFRKPEHRDSVGRRLGSSAMGFYAAPDLPAQRVRSDVLFKGHSGAVSRWKDRRPRQ